MVDFFRFRRSGLVIVGIFVMYFQWYESIGTHQAMPVTRSSHHEVVTIQLLDDQSHQSTLPSPASCFRPDMKRTLALMERNVSLSKPVINLGMPKVGSSTLFHFFRCSGWKASHWKSERQGLIGACMKRASVRNDPLLKSCDAWYFKKLWGSQNEPSAWDDKGAEAYLQMDFSLNGGRCRYPQIQDLDKLHQEAPNATFVLLFRPIQDWYRSMANWPSSNSTATLLERLQQCDLPGLPQGRGGSLPELEVFWCRHVRRVRDFVERHPSHRLVELDLYNAEQSARVMAKLFHSQSDCWGHANANSRLQAQSSPNNTR